MELVHARARRRFQRGLTRKPMGLIKKLRKAKKEAAPNEKPAPVKTHLRNMIIVPEMIGSQLGVYSGKVSILAAQFAPEMHAVQARIGAVWTGCKEQSNMSGSGTGSRVQDRQSATALIGQSSWTARQDSRRHAAPHNWQEDHAGMQKEINKSCASWESDAQTSANPATQLSQTCSTSLGTASKEWGHNADSISTLFSQQFNLVEVKPEMVGHYTGEFSISYQPVKHGRPGQSALCCQTCITDTDVAIPAGIGSTNSSRFIPLK